MLKLVKYEFRKARSALLALLGIAAVLEVYFLASLYSNHEDNMVVAGVLLFFCAYAAAIFVFVRGVTSYSGELKNTSSYLIFMTPNSTLKIMGSKYLYTFVNGLFFTVLFAVLTAVDTALALRQYGELNSFLETVRSFFSLYGVYLDQIGYGILFMLLSVLLSVLSTIAVAYFSITIGHTLFRDKKWRWLPSLVLFFALTWAINWLIGQFPTAWDQMVVVNSSVGDSTVQMEVTANAMVSVVIPSLLPAAGVSLATILLSLFGCAALLDKKVSL